VHMCICAYVYKPPIAPAAILAPLLATPAAGVLLRLHVSPILPILVHIQDLLIPVGFNRF
jgi:hypothetical protein